MNGANTLAALVRRTISGRDGYGKDVYTETVTTTPGIYSPTGTSESTVGGQDQVTDFPLLSLPTGTDVSAIDAVIPQVVVDASGGPVLDGDGQVQGVRFEVDGDPQVWPPNPWSGWQSAFSVDLRLRRVAG